MIHKDEKSRGVSLRKERKFRLAPCFAFLWEVEGETILFSFILTNRDHNVDVGILKHAGSEIILWRSYLGWWLGTCSGVGVFMREVAAWHCCHREMCPPLGRGFHPYPRSSGAQVGSRCWRSRFEAWCEGNDIFPLYLEGFSVESAVWEVACPAAAVRVSSARAGGGCGNWGAEVCTPTPAWMPARAVRGSSSLLGMLCCGSCTPIATIFPCHNSQSLGFFLVLLLKLGDDTC